MIFFLFFFCGGGTGLVAVETLLAFPVLLQTNILANCLSISGTGNSPGETSGLKMVAVEIVEFCFWRGTSRHTAMCCHAQSTCFPTEVSIVYFAVLLVDTTNCQIEFLISHVKNFAHAHTHTHTHSTCTNFLWNAIMLLFQTSSSLILLTFWKLQGTEHVFLASDADG